MTSRSFTPDTLVPLTEEDIKRVAQTLSYGYVNNVRVVSLLRVLAAMILPDPTKAYTVQQIVDFMEDCADNYVIIHQHNMEVRDF